jgi:hypothetical protein
MMKDYLPNDEPGLADWFDNWTAKMDGHGADHGFSAAEILQTKDDSMIVRNIVTGWQRIQAYRSEYSKFKRIIFLGETAAAPPDYPTLELPKQPDAHAQMLAGVFKRTRAFVRRLKASAKYNEAVAADFRVLLAKPAAIVPSEAKPVLKLKSTSDGRVEAQFTKNGFVGIELEMQRGSDATLWTSLGKFNDSPAEDTTPPGASNLPEVRRYRARYLQGNKTVGSYSDIALIITA